MAAYTTSVSPVGVSPGGPSIFRTIGSKIKDAKEQAVEARQEADQRIEEGSKRIAEIEAIPEKDRTEDDLEELSSLKQDVSSLKEKRSQKAYFFKKALKFQATDKIRTTIGKFQRDPELQNDPAATEKERFYAKAGLFRPNEMPDVSSREERNRDIVSYVGKGFQLIMDAIDKVKKRVSKTADTTEKTFAHASSTESKTEKVKQSTEDLNNNTESISNISKEEVKIQKSELDIAERAESDNEKKAAEATSELQNIGGEEGINVNEVGITPFSFLGKGINSIKEKVRFAREVAGRVAGRGRGAGSIRGLRLGRRTPRIQPKTAYSDPIGPQPMNSSTSWATRGLGERGGMYGQDGFVPRLPSQALSKGGIISTSRKSKKSNVSSSSPTLLTSPTNISGMGTKKMASGGIITPQAVKASDISPSTAVLPTDRGVGKKLIQGKKSDTENISKLFQLGPLVFGGIGFSSIAQLAQVPFLGTLLKAAKPMIAPVIKAFGLPENTMNLLFGTQKPVGAAAGAEQNFGAGQPPAPPPPPPFDPNVPPPETTQYNITNGQAITRDMFGRGMGVRDGLGSGSSAGGHTGRDVPLPEGTPLSIVPPGTVVDVGNIGDANDPDGTNGGYGNFVVVKLDDGRYVKSAHHKRNLVRVGDRVGIQPDGSVRAIGEVGSTGLSTGPHMHLDLATGYNEATAGMTGLMNPDNFILNKGIVRGGNVRASASAATPTPSATPTAATPQSNRPSSSPAAAAASIIPSPAALATATNPLLLGGAVGLTLVDWALKGNFTPPWPGVK